MTRNALSPAGETFAVLDANVLIPPRLSDILFDLALAGLYYPHWTATIEAEFLKNWPVVIGKRGQGSAVDPSGAKHRLECFRGATRGGYEVMGYAALEAQVPARVDPKDRHVVAAGLALRAYSDGGDEVFLVSSNVRHLAKRATAQLRVTVVRPGEFIDLLYVAAPALVEKAMLKVVRELENPTFPPLSVAGRFGVRGYCSCFSAVNRRGIRTTFRRANLTRG